MAELTRRDKTILLLRSRTDWHPSLRSQFAGFGGVPGEKASEWTPCPKCDTAGEVRGRGGMEPCKECGGDGRFLIDQYTEQREPERRPFNGPEREQWRKVTDASVARLKQQVEPPKSDADLIEEANQRGESWEEARARYYKSGDYRHLDLALEWLTVQSPPGRALIGWVYESGALELGCLHPTVLHAAETAVDVLATRMPDPIRIPHWLVRPPREGRWTKAA